MITILSARNIYLDLDIESFVIFLSDECTVLISLRVLTYFIINRKIIKEQQNGTRNNEFTPSLLIHEIEGDDSDIVNIFEWLNER